MSICDDKPKDKYDDARAIRARMAQSARRIEVFYVGVEGSMDALEIDEKRRHLMRLAEDLSKGGRL